MVKSNTVYRLMENGKENSHHFTSNSAFIFLSKVSAPAIQHLDSETSVALSNKPMPDLFSEILHKALDTSLKRISAQLATCYMDVYDISRT